MADTSNVDRSSITLNVSERPARFSSDPVSEISPERMNRNSDIRYIDDDAFHASRSGDLQYSEEAATFRFSNNLILDERQCPRFSDIQMGTESRNSLTQAPNSSREPVTPWIFPADPEQHSQLASPAQTQGQTSGKPTGSLEPILSALRDVCDVAAETIPRTKEGIFYTVPSESITNQQKEITHLVAMRCDSVLARARRVAKSIVEMDDPRLPFLSGSLCRDGQGLLRDCLGLFNDVKATQNIGFTVTVLVNILRPLHKAVKHAAKLMKQSQ